MKGKIVNFRLSRHRQSSNHMIISVSGVSTRKKASELVGKKVVFKTESGKEINGKVASAHGNSGAIRAIFEKGMPGQALAQIVEIL
jgi:large subunit ribosomal protein L35Ae